MSIEPVTIWLAILFGLMALCLFSAMRRVFRLERECIANQIELQILRNAVADDLSGFTVAERLAADELGISYPVSAPASNRATATDNIGGWMGGA